MVKLVPAAGVLAAIATPLSASPVSGTLAVSAVVEQACHLDVRPIHFAGLRSDGAHGDAESSVAVACTPETAFVVSLDDGQHRADGSRRMTTATGNMLNYELYRDAGRTRRWGASPDETVAGVISGGSTVTLPIYARVQAANASAGAYSDVVTVTVSF